MYTEDPHFDFGLDVSPTTATATVTDSEVVAVTSEAPQEVVTDGGGEITYNKGQNYASAVPTYGSTGTGGYGGKRRPDTRYNNSRYPNTTTGGEGAGGYTNNSTTTNNNATYSSRNFTNTNANYSSNYGNNNTNPNTTGYVPRNTANRASPSTATTNSLDGTNIQAQAQGQTYNQQPSQLHQQQGVNNVYTNTGQRSSSGYYNSNNNYNSDINYNNTNRNTTQYTNPPQQQQQQLQQQQQQQQQQQYNTTTSTIPAQGQAVYTDPRSAQAGVPAPTTGTGGAYYNNNYNSNSNYNNSPRRQYSNNNYNNNSSSNNVNATPASAAITDTTKATAGSEVVLPSTTGGAPTEPAPATPAVSNDSLTTASTIAPSATTSTHVTNKLASTATGGHNSDRTSNYRGQQPPRGSTTTGAPRTHTPHTNTNNTNSTTNRTGNPRSGPPKSSRTNPTPAPTAAVKPPSPAIEFNLESDFPTLGPHPHPPSSSTHTYISGSGRTAAESGHPHISTSGYAAALKGSHDIHHHLMPHSTTETAHSDKSTNSSKFALIATV